MLRKAVALCNLVGEKINNEYIPKEEQVFSEEGCNYTDMGRSVLY